MDADTPGYIHTSNQDASCIHPTSAVDIKTDTTAVGSTTTDADVQPIAEEVGFVHPEGGWGWLVMLSAMWCNGAVFGFRNVFGILFVSLLKEFGSEDDEDLSFRTSWVGSLSFGMIFFCSPVVGVLTNALGCRATAVGGAALALMGLLASSFVTSLGPMYFTYGVVFSAGCSFAFQPSLVILGHYFKRRLGLVNGMVTAGSSVFTVVLALVLPGLLERAGLHDTLRLLSVLMVVLMLAGLTYTPLLPAGRESRTLGEEVLDVNIWKSLGFRLWAFGIHIALYTYFVPFVHLMKFAEERFGPDDVVDKELLLVCIGVASGVGRLACGWAGDRVRGVDKVYLQASSFLAVGLMSMTMPLCHAFGELMAVCLTMGLFSCFLCMMTPVASELVGPAELSRAIGSMLGMMALPVALGAPFVGFLRDRLGSYDVAFYVAGVPPIVGGAVLCLIPWVEARRRGKEELKQDTQQTLVL